MDGKLSLSIPFYLRQCPVMPAAIDKTIILKAALDVWREEGYRNATTRKVADRAGVGEVTLFRRFGDKAALFEAALATEAATFQVAGVVYTADLKADLVAMVKAYQSLLDRNGSIVLDFLIEAPHNPVLARIGQTPGMAIQGAAILLARYQSQGKLRQGDPIVQVSALLGPLVMRHAVGRAQAGFDRAISAEGVVQTFLRGWENPTLTAD